MKRLRFDIRAESVFRPFILLLGCMLIFSIISLTLINRMSDSSSSVNTGISQDSNVLGLWEYHLIDPVAGIAITTAKTTNHMIHPKDSTIIFTDNNHTPVDQKYVQVIRNNVNYDPSSTDMWKMYKDFISIQRKTTPSLITPLNYKWNGAAISFEYIQNAFDTKTNMSIVGFQLSGYNDTLFIKLASNNTALLWANSFTLYYGWSNVRADKIDLWSSIWMILSCQIPGLNPQIQFVVSAFWMFGEVFIAFTMASRIIPTLGGG